jgi:hypothetical protein
VSELNAYDRIAAAIVSFLRLCRLDKHQGLCVLEKARGWFIEQFVGSATDEMIAHSGHYLNVALRSYNEADQQRENCPGREAVAYDELGRMPMLTGCDLAITPVPGEYQYPCWMWQGDKWMPIKIVTGVPLEPGTHRLG